MFEKEPYFVDTYAGVGRAIALVNDVYFLVLLANGEHITALAISTPRVPAPKSTTYSELYW